MAPDFNTIVERTKAELRTLKAEADAVDWRNYHLTAGAQFYGGLAVLVLAVLLFFGGHWLLGPLLAAGSVVYLIKAGPKAPIVKIIRPQAVTDTPWPSVIVPGLLVGGGLGVIACMMLVGAAPGVMASVLGAMMTGGGGVAIEWELWRRSGYFRFQHLWGRAAVESVVFVAAAVFIAVVCGSPLRVLAQMFPIPPDAVISIFQFFGHRPPSRDALVWTLWWSTETPVFLTLLVGTWFAFERRLWIAKRRALFGPQPLRELIETIIGFLRGIESLVALARSLAILSVTAIILGGVFFAHEFIEAIAMEQLKKIQIPQGIFVLRAAFGIIVIFAFNIVLRGLLLFLDAFDKAPKIPSDKLASGRLASAADLRRAGVTSE